MTSRYILSLVEKEFDNYDLKKYNKSVNYIYPRYVYFELCRQFTEESLYSIGRTIDRDHATVLHGYKKFKYFTKPEVKARFMDAFRSFTKLRSQLVNIVIDYDKVKKPTTIYEIELEEEIKKKYEKKLIELQKSYNNVLKKRDKIITTYEGIFQMESVQDIVKLPPNDIAEFDRLAKIFYKRKMHEKQYV